LLVGRKQRVLQRLDQRVGLNSLVAFELLDELDEFSAHLLPPSTRFPRPICPDGMRPASPPSAPPRTACSSAAMTSPRNLLRPSISAAVRSLTVRATKPPKWHGFARGAP